jgi:hypothetical protein
MHLKDESRGGEARKTKSAIASVLERSSAPTCLLLERVWRASRSFLSSPDLHGKQVVVHAKNGLSLYWKDVVVDNEGSQVETDYIFDIPLGTKRLNLGDITRKTDFSDTFFVNFQSPGISLQDAQGNAITKVGLLPNEGVIPRKEFRWLNDGHLITKRWENEI